jgi:hypothetical protein
MLLPSWAVQVHMYAKCYGYIITVHFGIISIIVLHSICIYHDDDMTCHTVHSYKLHVYMLQAAPIMVVLISQFSNN